MSIYDRAYAEKPRVTKDEFLKALELATWQVKWFQGVNEAFPEGVDELDTPELYSSYHLNEYNLKCSLSFFIRDTHLFLHLFFNKSRDIFYQEDDWSKYQLFEIYELPFDFVYKSEILSILQKRADAKIREFWSNFIKTEYEKLEKQTGEEK
jgi:hypothetical protein